MTEPARPDTPTPGPFSVSGFDLGTVIAIHAGPDGAGHAYVDGRHQHTIARCERIADAYAIVDALNIVDVLRKAVAEAREALRPSASPESRANADRALALALAFVPCIPAPDRPERRGSTMSPAVGRNRRVLK